MYTLCDVYCPRSGSSHQSSRLRLMSWLLHCQSCRQLPCMNCRKWWVASRQANIRKTCCCTGLNENKHVSLQNAKNESIAEWKTVIAEKTQKLVCDSDETFNPSLQTICFVNLVGRGKHKLCVVWCVSGPGKGGCQQPEGGHRQTQVSDCGVSWGAEESDGEDEGERQEHQDIHCELKAETNVFKWLTTKKYNRLRVVQLFDEVLMALILGRHRWVCGGAAEHGAECDSHRGRDPTDAQPAAGPGEQHEQHQAATGGGMNKEQVSQCSTNHNTLTTADDAPLAVEGKYKYKT